MKKIAALICIISLCAGLCACGGLEGAQPEGAVTSNGGIAVSQGDWVYFINGKMPETEAESLLNSAQSSIYRMKNDGSEKAKLTRQKAYELYVSGNRIFFVSVEKSGLSLCCINIDGTGERKLLSFADGGVYSFGENGVAVAKEDKIYYFAYSDVSQKEFVDCTAEGLFVSKSYVYFYRIADGVMNRVRIDSGNKETFGDGCGRIVFASDDTVYFASARLLFKVDMNTLEKTQITQTLYVTMLINMKNNALVCIESNEDNEGLYLLSLDNIAGSTTGQNARQKLHVKAVSAFYLTDENIYFCETETGDVYRVDYAGQNKTKLCTLNIAACADIDLVGERLFMFEDTSFAFSTVTDGSGTISRLVTEEEQEG